MATALSIPTDQRVVWAPQAGSQVAFLQAADDEVLYHGTRGNGKTDCLLMSFASQIGLWGALWRGVIFRRESTQLEDVIAKAVYWFAQIFPAAKYLGGNANKFIWPTGEQLLFRHMRVVADYAKYHGHEYPFVGFEELTNWPSADCYDASLTLCRSKGPKEMPRWVRSTCNPYGAGHSWVKAMFIDPVPDLVGQVTKEGKTRRAIGGKISENKLLLANDPGYLKTLEAITDPNKRAAWLKGSWDIVSGTILDGCWNPDINVLEPFKIPTSWKVDRAFDWGSSRPYSVGWFAESDGSPVEVGGKEINYPRGSKFLIDELYGWNGKPNQGLAETNKQIATRIKSIEAGRLGGLISGGHEIYPGPADRSIFDVINGDSYADEMAREGVRWLESYKGAGSRIQGWQRLRSMCLAAREQPRESPGFYVFSNCRQWLRTVPTLPCDDKNPDDVDTEAEDHSGDMTRYELLRERLAEPGKLDIGRIH